MYIGLHVKYPIFLSDFNKIYNFLSDRVSKNTQILNLMKICPVGAELMYAVGQRDERTDRNDETNIRV